VDRRLAGRQRPHGRHGLGGVAHERIQFNESTVWTGEPHDYAHKGAAQSLAKIRELLWAGKQKEAEDLAMKEFMSDPIRQKAYQSLGDLIIETPGSGSPTNYKRSLDLDTGIATTAFTANGIEWRREVFVSHPANAIVVHLTSSRPAPVTASLKCGHTGCKDGASLSGQVEDSAIRFDARLDQRTEGTSTTFILTAATNFKNYRDVSADPAQRNAATLAAIGKKPMRRSAPNTSATTRPSSAASRSISAQLQPPNCPPTSASPRSGTAAIPRW
jgi:alpha-L-fucosidase 2